MIEEGAAERLLGKLARKTGNVPLVQREHLISLSASGARCADAYTRTMSRS
jgi:hypothetical protein